MKYLSILSLMMAFTAFSTGVQAQADAQAEKQLTGKLRAAVTEKAKQDGKNDCGACFGEGSSVRISAAAAGSLNDPKAFLMVVTPQAEGCARKCEVTIMKTPDMQL